MKFDSVRADGSTLRQHQEKALRNRAKSGKVPQSVIDAAREELRSPPLSSYAQQILNLYYRLSKTSGQGFNGKLPITYSEIKAFVELTETPLCKEEVNLLVEIDSGVQDIIAELQAKKE